MEVEELPGAPGVIRVGELGPGRAETGLGMSPPSGQVGLNKSSPSELVGLDLPGHRRAVSHNTGHLQGRLADRPQGGQAPSESWLLWFCWISPSRSAAPVTITKGSRASRVRAGSNISSREDGSCTGPV